MLQCGRSGPGILHVFDENLTGPKHYNIIKTYARQASEKLFSGKWWLLADNDPKTVTSEILGKLEKLKINRLPISRYSPDLNVSEDVINILKNNTAAQNPATIEHAKRILKREFKKLSPSILQSLVDSMGRRCQAVIDAEGGYPDH